MLGICRVLAFQIEARSTLIRSDTVTLGVATIETSRSEKTTTHAPSSARFLPFLSQHRLVQNNETEPEATSCKPDHAPPDKCEQREARIAFT